MIDESVISIDDDVMTDEHLIATAARALKQHLSHENHNLLAAISTVEILKVKDVHDCTKHAISNNNIVFITIATTTSTKLISIFTLLRITSDQTHIDRSCSNEFMSSVLVTVSVADLISTSNDSSDDLQQADIQKKNAEKQNQASYAVIVIRSRSVSAI